MTVDELIEVKTDTRRRGGKISEIVDLALKGVSLAMGVGVIVLSLMNKLEANEAISMLGLGLACLAVTQFSKEG